MIVLPQHLDPRGVGRMPAARHLHDVAGHASGVVEESIDGRGKRWRGIVIEEDPHAAFRWVPMNATARLTARTGTAHTRAAASGEPSAAAAAASASAGTEVSASIGFPNERSGS